MENESLEVGQAAEGIIHLVFNRVIITSSALVILYTVLLVFKTHYVTSLMRLCLLDLYHTWAVL